MDQEIVVSHLFKTYRVPVRKHGLYASMKSLFKPEYKDVNAVRDINFMIRKGEIVGFIGPNGAGKTTTLKMLSGLLYPSEGEIQVAGYVPYKRKADYLRKIGLIMGNKSQLSWDITVMDSFHIIKEIYNVSDKDFQKGLDELVELLELKELLNKLSRNLSLGERAKCEFAASLIHKPDILFLDEPTLGMDVSIQIKLRKFIKEYCKKYNTTVIVTSHYMADITSLCSRVILINKGTLIYDGELDKIVHKISNYKIIKITLSEQVNDVLEYEKEIIRLINDNGSVVQSENRKITLRIKKESVSDTASILMKVLPLEDITIEDIPIEEVIEQIYREGVSQ